MGTLQLRWMSLQPTGVTSTRATTIYQTTQDAIVVDEAKDYLPRKKAQKCLHREHCREQLLKVDLCIFAVLKLDQHAVGDHQCSVVPCT